MVKLNNWYFFIKAKIYINMMTLSYEEFIKKYSLENVNNKLELKGQEKIDFYNDLDKLLRVICRIFDKITNIASLRGGQVLMSLAKLQNGGSVTNKTDVMRSLNIDRLEKLKHAFDYLKRENYINIEEKTEKFHIVSLNEQDNPDLTIFREIIQKYWLTPEQEIAKTRRWIEG
ncbi:MAG: hypothetical protein WBH31_02590 [Promethearchaeia archaeon]